MLIRRERPGDEAAVERVHAAAFPAGGAGVVPEVELVRRLRADPGWLPPLSMVAVVDDLIVGHVTCTRGHIDAEPALGLAPLGVLPDRHGNGIGSALVHAVLAVAEALGERTVCLLGDPAYYQRFDFGPAATVGIDPPDPDWGHHFQARALQPGPPPRGRFTYAAPFAGL